jgi:hypothetical protein
MKDYLGFKMGWLAFVLIAVIISTGCPKKTHPPEAPPTKPSEAPPVSTGPREPSPPSPRSGPPSVEPAPFPSDEGPSSYSPPPSPPTVKPAPPGETYFTHTIKWSGETLWMVALWYTGHRSHWKEISEAMTRVNPDVNIHVIRIGDKIPIPESLMKTREPMTKDFVESFYKPKEPPKPTPPQEPDLFGPKERLKKEQ